MENLLTNRGLSAHSSFFKTVEEVIEFQANDQIMMNEPQNLVDDEAVTRHVFHPKTKEASRLTRELGLSKLIDDRYKQLYKETYGVELKEHMNYVLEEIKNERQRQKDLAHGGDTDDFDKSNSKNDWIAYVNAYTGRAAEKVFRNEKEGQTFRENMIKAAALIIAAIEAHDNNYC